MAELEATLEALVRDEAHDVVAAGRANIEVRYENSAGGSYRVINLVPIRKSACPVTIVAQSDREVSFFVGPPREREAMTVDLWDRDQGELLDGVRAYLRAVLAGRVEVDARSGSSGGRVTFVLEDAQRHRHYYNAMAGPRLQPWARHRFDPY